MQIVLRAPAGELELDVELRNPEGTLADLVRAALGEPVPAFVTVAGRSLPSDTPVLDSGLHEAAVLSVAPPAPGGRAAVTALFELVVVAGAEGGRVLPVPLGQSSVGRGAQNALALGARTVSRRHALLAADLDGVLVRDAGSANGTWIDGQPVVATALLQPGQVLQVGRVALRLRTTVNADRPHGLDPVHRAGPAGTVPVNRPPRPVGPPIPDPLAVPQPAATAAAAPFGFATFLAALAGAGLLILVTGSLRSALLSAAMPLLAVGGWYEARRRARSGARHGQRRFAAALGELQQHADAAARQERARREELAPDLGEVLRRARLPSTRLWERRAGRPDALQLTVGVADVPWLPPHAPAGAVDPQVREVLAAIRLPAAPVLVDLAQGGVVGIAGGRAVGLDVARALLLQAGVQCGPADLTVAVAVDPDRERDWDWAKWLPHVRVPGQERAPWLAAGREQAEALARRLRAGPAAASGSRAVLVVVDSDVLLEGRGAAVRELLATGRRPRDPAGQPAAPLLAGIVLAATADRLPASCTVVVRVPDADGLATLQQLDEGTAVEQVLAARLDEPTARAAARDLARFEDPELAVPGSALPDQVRLLPLLDLPCVDGPAVLDRWRRGGREPGAVAPVGVTESGRLLLDLVRDGAHGLVGGTTGAGKSELLRTLVASLAVQASPEHLTFVLIDYKGGAAFDACARLPHTVGLVTDLDERLGERALRALEAELHHRERLLRAAGADNLSAYLAGAPATPMPRLVVVVDEFATLAADLPAFVSSLVGVAQRGRTLGVHLLLATQRPSGVIGEDIRANTNLRIALRVQDSGDSIDVLGVADAARLPRSRPGRAYVRFGPGEVLPVQTALVTCVSDERADGAVDVRPFVFGPRTGLDAPVAGPDTGPDTGVPSDLIRLVDAVVAAHALSGAPLPRRPWPEPLPPLLPLDVVGAWQDQTVHVALADEPSRQRQVSAGWDLRDGNLLVLGVPGSGTTTALASLALVLAAALPPAALELQVLDAGPGDLAPLTALPHVGSVVLAGDRERQTRLLRWLRGELDRRRALPRGEALSRRTVVLLDGLPALRAAFDDVDGLALLDQLARVFRDGPEVGLWCAVTADRPGALPAAYSSVARQRWVLRLADPFDWSSVGVARGDIPAPVPGRALLLPAGLQAQVGQPVPSLAAACARVAERWAGAQRAAVSIGVLPAAVPLADLPPPNVVEEPWRLPVGIRDSDLAPAVLPLHQGDHVLVSGPARSGRSTALAMLAASLAPHLQVIAIGGRRSPLRSCPDVDAWVEPDGLADLTRELPAGPGRVLLLVDDAEDVEDPEGVLAGLVAGPHRPPHLHVVAAGRAEVLRSRYGHWTQQVRRSRLGLLLRPDLDLDGDLLGAVLPRRAPVALGAGRGYLVADGGAGLLQVAQP